MLSTNAAVVVFLITCAGILLTEIIEKKVSEPGLLKIICYTFISAGVLNLLEGISLMFDWNIIPSDADTSGFAKHRRGGFALLLIKFWPYLLSLLGVSCAFIYWSILKRLKQ